MFAKYMDEDLLVDCIQMSSFLIFAHLLRETHALFLSYVQA